MENSKYLKALDDLTSDDINSFEEDGTLPRAITDIVTLSPVDMKFYFNLIPDMTPTTGGYIFDDIRISMQEHGIEVEKQQKNKRKKKNMMKKKTEQQEEDTHLIEDMLQPQQMILPQYQTTTKNICMTHQSLTI